MRIIEPSFTIEDELDGEEILRRLERFGRTCYKSEAKITADSARGFIGRILAMGHESVIEHEKVTVRIVCDRGVSHELVRHRIASYSQESTRYCDYAPGGKVGQLRFIRPCFCEEDSASFRLWRGAMNEAESYYNALRKVGAQPQEARSVLPNSLKTEIVATMNLREWRHFFRLRTSKAAHPQMRQIAVPLLEEFRRRVPVIFDDIPEAG